MNQFGLVEIGIVKNEKPYRILLPLGAPWQDAHDALADMLAQIADHIAAIKEQEAASQLESTDEPVVVAQPIDPQAPVVAQPIDAQPVDPQVPVDAQPPVDAQAPVDAQPPIA
jgi:hypothetical protein